jgi:hypothetical protein
VLRTCSTGSGPNSIAPTARKRSNILDFERRTRNLTNPRSSSGGDGFLGGLSTVVVGIETQYGGDIPPNQPSEAMKKWRIVAARTKPSVGDRASPSVAVAVGDSCDSSPVVVPDSPPSVVLESCIAAIASRVIGLPRASALPPRTIRTCSVGLRVSSSSSWDADADADAELTTDWRSMSTEGWGERVWRRLILGCLLPLVVRLNGRGAFILTILLYHSKIHWDPR